MRQALGPGALGGPGGSGWRGRWEGGSGWGRHVNPWLFHFNVQQNPLQKKTKTMHDTNEFLCLQDSETFDNIETRHRKNLRVFLNHSF